MLFALLGRLEPGLTMHAAVLLDRVFGGVVAMLVVAIFVLAAKDQPANLAHVLLHFRFYKKNQFKNLSLIHLSGDLAVLTYIVDGFEMFVE